MTLPSRVVEHGLVGHAGLSLAVRSVDCQFLGSQNRNGLPARRVHEATANDVLVKLQSPAPHDFDASQPLTEE
jgi:hypothetical protein